MELTMTLEPQDSYSCILCSEETKKKPHIYHLAKTLGSTLDESEISSEAVLADAIDYVSPEHFVCVCVCVCVFVCVLGGGFSFIEMCATSFKSDF